jgi:hypothetical protein
MAVLIRTLVAVPIRTSVALCIAPLVAPYLGGSLYLYSDYKL